MAWYDPISVIINLATKKPTSSQWYAAFQAIIDKIEGLTLESLSRSDTTTNNADLFAHGMMPKGDGNVTHFYRSDGTQAVPPGGVGLGGSTGPVDGAILVADGVDTDTLKASAGIIDVDGNLTGIKIKEYIPINAKDFLTGPAEAGYWDTDELPNGFPQIRMKYTHTEAHACFAEVQMPEDWDGGDLTIADTWKTPSADLNTFALDVYAVRIADGDTDDVAITTKVATITDTNTGAGKNNQSAESSAFTITGTGKKIRFRFVRDYGTDTIEDFVNLLEVMIKCIVIKA
jgi:hypothetical protein